MAEINDNKISSSCQPFLAWLAALGIAAAVRATYWAAQRSGRPRLWAALRVGLVGALSICLVLRAMETLAIQTDIPPGELSSQSSSRSAWQVYSGEADNAELRCFVS